jgi:glycosyltransferase involved in cell wall biosynthesis
MRILFVIHQFFPEFGGGTEHVALNLARMAQRGGHHVQVLACGVQPGAVAGEPVQTPVPGSVRAVHQGLPVLFLPRAALPASAEIAFDADEPVATALAGWLRAQAFDLAHVMHTMRMGTALLALQRAGIPYLVTLTDFFLPCAQINLVNLAGEPCEGPLEGARCASDCLAAPWTPPAYAARYQQARSLLAAAAERCAPSAFVAERYRAAFPELDFRVLPHGLDLLQLAGRAAPPPARQPGPLRLAYVGSIVRQKGLDVLLRALTLLPGADVRLSVVGGAWGNTGYHAEVLALAEADARVEFVGKLAPQQVFQRLREADLLCVPSRVPESFSLVLHEAAAAGTPALVADLGAPAGFVEAHRCGQAVAAGDAPAWAGAIGALAGDRGRIAAWRDRLPLPLRVEEEAFFYESLYRRIERRPAQA